MREWLKRIDKDAKDAREKRIFDLWLACHTQQEIAEAVGVSKMEVSRTCNEMADVPESYQAAAAHLTDFTPPLYNVWKQQDKTPGTALCPRFALLPVRQWRTIGV